MAARMYAWTERYVPKIGQAQGCPSTTRWRFHFAWRTSPADRCTEATSVPITN
jgi:hypothetical protein